MNDLKIFENKEFGEIRTVVKDGEPWFVGVDIATALGYSNTRDAIAKHIDNEDKATVAIHDGRQKRNITAINESGLYSLILSSELPSAKAFKRWVTSEVLPSIRKNGGYIVGQDTMTDDELMARALQVAQNKIQERDKQIETMKPKAIFADAVAASHTSILVGELAKILKQNGVNIGQNRLYEWLRENGYLIRGNKRTDRNAPTQRSMDMGLFEVKISTVVNSDGSVRETRTTKVTGKGQQYFINKFLTE
ncbi:phage antirepressor KilAC domain-containing protein [Coprococcus sp. RTP31081st1_D2_RTP31081_211007]|uniref:phage antirepressor n=1 Tax=unclassified Coprococcus TaxID=2684943 RepID=UPI0032F01FD8